MHIKCQIQGSEITKKLFLMGAKRERDLHKSLKLLLKECEKGLWLFIDLRLKSSNLKESNNHSFRRDCRKSPQADSWVRCRKE